MDIRHSTSTLNRMAFSVASLEDESDEMRFWLTQTPQERLLHMELLRRINYGYRATERLQRFLRLLNSYQVEYLLIGGYAVAYHGYPRATNDMDVWVAIHPDNAERLVSVLQAFGFSVPELSKELFLEEEKIIRMGVPPMRIEILTSISGVTFKECYADRIVDEMDECRST